MTSAPKVHPEKGAFCAFEVTPGPNITERQRTACAALFSCCYGVWSVEALWEQGFHVQPGALSRCALLAETVC
jgi:hypothetical protein